MKHILILLLFAGLSNCAFAKEQQMLFKKANDEYARGAYSQALENYKAIEVQGFRSAELYFNMGNTYFKLDSLAPAILYYERARLLNPDDEDILFNLDLANQKTVDRVDKMPVLFIKDWWQRLGAKLSLEGWSFLSITFFWIGILALALYILAAGRMNKILFFTTAGVLIIVGTAAYFIAASQNSRLNLEKEGIIYASRLTVTSAPNAGKELFVLHEGTKVRILDKDNSWVKIRLGNGSVGWIPQSSIEGI